MLDQPTTAIAFLSAEAQRLTKLHAQAAHASGSACSPAFGNAWATSVSTATARYAAAEGPNAISEAIIKLRDEGRLSFLPVQPYKTAVAGVNGCVSMVLVSGGHGH